MHHPHSSDLLYPHRNIATALKNEHGDAYFKLFDEFSRTSSSYDKDASAKLWASVARPDYDGPKLELGSLVYMARADSTTSVGLGAEGANNEAAEALAFRTGSSDRCLTAELVQSTSLATSANYDDLRILLRVFPEFEKLDNCSFNTTSDMIQFETVGGLRGKINKTSKVRFYCPRRTNY